MRRLFQGFVGSGFLGLVRMLSLPCLAMEAEDLRLRVCRQRGLQGVGLHCRFFKSSGAIANGEGSPCCLYRKKPVHEYASAARAVAQGRSK